MKKKATNYNLILGLLFIGVDVPFFDFDLVPDFIGYILLLFYLRAVSSQNNSHKRWLILILINIPLSLIVMPLSDPLIQINIYYYLTVFPAFQLLSISDFVVLELQLYLSWISNLLRVIVTYFFISQAIQTMIEQQFLLIYEKMRNIQSQFIIFEVLDLIVTGALGIGSILIYLLPLIPTLSIYVVLVFGYRLFLYISLSYSFYQLQTQQFELNS